MAGKGEAQRLEVDNETRQIMELHQANKAVSDLEAANDLMAWHHDKLREAQREAHRCATMFEDLKSLPLNSDEKVRSFEEFLSYKHLNGGDMWEGEVVVDGETDQVKQDRLKLVKKIVKDHGATRRITIVPA